MTFLDFPSPSNMVPQSKSRESFHTKLNDALMVADRFDCLVLLDQKNIDFQKN